MTSEPPKVAVSINKQNLTHKFIQESRVFTASILSKDTPLRFIGAFGFKSGRDTDKFAQVEYEIGKTGAPVVTDHSVGCLEVKVVDMLDAGTHTVFIGRIVEAEVLKDEESLTYAYYHKIKRGVAPKTAPNIYQRRTSTERRENRKVQVHNLWVCL